MNEVKKLVLFALALMLLSGIVAAFGPFYLDKDESQLNTFSSYAELRDFVESSMQIGYPYYGGFGSQLIRPLYLTDANQITSGVSAVPEYSSTNVQVAGVDEADIVKTDGEFIYVVSGSTVTILKAYPASEAQIVSRIALNGTVQGIFINGDRMAVFESAECTLVKVYDISNRADPFLARTVPIEGGYLNSRMIEDYVYAIVQQPVIQWVYPAGSDAHSEVILPKITVNGQSEEIPPSDIYYSSVADRFGNYALVVSVNVLDDQIEPVTKTFLIGETSTIYVSQDNIYLTFSPSPWYTSAGGTVIQRIHVEDGQIEPAASGEVEGRVLNQFSMDEYNGYFRIATTIGEVSKSQEATSENRVYILNSDLSIVSRLEDLAPGEKIHSARFMGDRAYLVTFKKIDPLFVLDLSDPANPRVLGELKVTGYSDYLHPYDETHIIGIGKETVEGEGGNFAWYQGIKISLFDVSDVANPKEIAKYTIGDRGSDSPVLNDHKAFLFDRSKHLLVIPVTVAKIDPNDYGGNVPPWAYGNPVWSGAYIFDITLEQGLTLKGTISHADNATASTNNSYDYSKYSVTRSLYIDNVLYTISASKIKMNSLPDLGEIKQVSLSG